MLCAPELTAEDCYTAALLGCVEAIKSGTTCINDFMYVHPRPRLSDQVIRAFREVGIRGILTRGIVDVGENMGIPKAMIQDTDKALEDCKRLIQKYEGSANGKVHVWVRGLKQLYNYCRLLICVKMDLLEEGTKEIIGKHDPEEHRQWVLKNKSRALEDKVMGIEEAVSKFVKDGSYVEYGFFGTRISMAGIYEIIRQKKKALDIGRGGVFELDILCAAGLVKRVERGYGGGFEVRGLGPASRRAVESGNVEIIEWSNTAHAWRLKAAAMGIPFIPTKSLLGTDTLKYSSAKVVNCPFTGKRVCLLPASYPDVALIHVNRCDKYGNAQIDGSKVMDVEIAMAARRVILTTEKLVDTDLLRGNPERTDIPYFYVDAVVEVPFGSHPSNVPGLYYMDEEYIAEWLNAAKTPEGAEKFLEKYIYGYKDYDEYLELIGGIKKLNYLARLEQFREPLKTPWAGG